MNHSFMMAAMMTSRNSCQFNYQKIFSQTYKRLSTANGQVAIDPIAMSKRTVLVTALVGLLLTGCQSTPTNDLTNIAAYQTSTRPNDNRNLDQQEIARVRTSLAAQYIRKNELDTAQRQLEKAFAADSRYAPAYDMMGVLLQQEAVDSISKKPINILKKRSRLIKILSKPTITMAFICHK
ncbi:type IV pilus biogenesis protein PilF [Psychrobacter sp. JCM 18903]|uniref:tetratricopeptide repeat protein n=1 Tax=Psychrobacter sp. JCM 18903 TaxID=1298610 RepID=UPI0004338656|nr:hypothetical protein [Psychrobacter sp. JCM 18903]GAF60511.1 type IV pilus biogenesis protein PilF [Psychrobacter sp. JCM 18903]